MPPGSSLRPGDRLIAGAPGRAFRASTSRWHIGYFPIRRITTRFTLRRSAEASGMVLFADRRSRWILAHLRFSPDGRTEEKSQMNRRQWLYGAGLIAGAGQLGLDSSPAS